MSARIKQFLIVIFAFINCINAMNLGRIVGGSKTTIEAAPFIVSLQYKGVHNCGGSILNSNWILTAAHCLSDESMLIDTTIVTGTTNIEELAKTTQIRNIDYYKLHEKYKGGVSPYDIAIIYTRKPFKWSSAVKPINLPPIQNKTITGFATLYGWGSTSTTLLPEYPKDLQVASRLPLLSYERCKKVLDSLNASDDFDNTNICTGPLRERKAACSADSGGPLIQGIQNPELIGIVSWGSVPCGQIGVPTVYVKVADFINWIKMEQQQQKHQL